MQTLENINGIYSQIDANPRNPDPSSLTLTPTPLLKKGGTPDQNIQRAIY